MINYTIVRRIATIKEWSTTTLELNIVKWGDGPEKYDLRRWDGDSPGRGLTLTEEDLEELFNVIGEELDLFEIEDEDEDRFPYISTCPTDLYEDEPKQEELDYRNFFVHGNGRCNKPDHFDQENVIAVLQVLKNDMSIEEVEIEASFCQNCNAYYISERDYQVVKRKGRLLCQLMSDEEYRIYKQQMEFGELKPQSILNMVGYTVNSQDDYTDEYRQQILSFAIDSGIITKKDAIGYLSFFIHLNEGHPNFTEAISKWHRDRNFLTGYVPGAMRKVYGKIIVLPKR
jgi:hypothetical protein